MQVDLQILPAADIPDPGPGNDGKIIIEDGAEGARSVWIFINGQRIQFAEVSE